MTDIVYEVAPTAVVSRSTFTAGDDIWSAITVVTTRDDRFTRMEVWETADFDAAEARFRELVQERS